MITAYLVTFADVHRREKGVWTYADKSGQGGRNFKEVLIFTILLHTSFIDDLLL